MVINADSAQVYSDLRVLSARPTEDEMGGIEHRLFGTWDGAQPCSAADWAATAKREIAALHEEGAVPILVGGTGLYLRTLLDGIAPVPAIDADIRATVRALPQPEARSALEREDAGAAARLAPADSSRAPRARWKWCARLDARSPNGSANEPAGSAAMSPSIRWC